MLVHSVPIVLVSLLSPLQPYHRTIVPASAVLLRRTAANKGIEVDSFMLLVSRAYSMIFDDFGRR